MDSNNRNELNNNRNNATIRKLKKVNRTIPQDKVQPTKPDTVHIQQNNPQQQHPQNAAVQPVQSHLKKAYIGKHEAEPSAKTQYVPKHAAENQNQIPKHDLHDAEYEEFDSKYDQNSLLTQAVKPVNPKKPRSYKDLLVKISSVTLSFVLIALLVFNMPIIAYTNNKNGANTVENVSILTFLKKWQPLVNIEGNLSSVSVADVNHDVVHDKFDDGLNLPQIVEGQYTVLFLGFDESGLNDDVNWIFQFDIAKGSLNVLQIPRDTCMPDYAGSTGKFNSIYSGGDSTVSPIQRVVNAVQDNFGIPIDSYVTTNCYNIVDIVNLIGGIPITLDEQMMYEADKIIPAGKSVLTGQQAEWFLRYRRTFKGEGDIGRVKNQRKFLAAAMSKMLNIVEEDGEAKFYGYLKQIYDKQYALTDMSLEDISMLADLASTLKMDNVQVHLLPGEGAWYYPENSDAQSVWSIHKQAAIDLINQYFRPYQIPLTDSTSAMTELVTDYLNTSNDSASDNLDDIYNGNQKAKMIDDYEG